MYIILVFQQMRRLLFKEWNDAFSLPQSEWDNSVLNDKMCRKMHLITKLIVIIVYK